MSVASLLSPHPAPQLQRTGTGIPLLPILVFFFCEFTTPLLLSLAYVEKNPENKTKSVHPFSMAINTANNNDTIMVQSASIRRAICAPLHQGGILIWP